MGVSNTDQALATYAAMQRWLYVSDGTGLYREAYPFSGGNPYSYVWPFSRALIGTLSLAGALGGDATRLPGALDLRGALDDRLAGLATYWAAWGRPPSYASYVVPPLGQGGDTYYDDNVWVALALVELHQLGLLASVQRAQQIFELGRSAWHRQPGDPHPGGVFWVQQGSGQGRTNHDRGAGLTAGYARLGLLLHELMGSSSSSSSLAFDRDALNMLNWVDASLDSSHSGTGPYWNALRRDGSIDTNVWAYVQGEMIATRAIHYRLTRDRRSLDLAEGIARQTLATFGAFVGHPPPFNAMCFQALLLLSSLTGDSDLRADIRQTIAAYADWAWDADSGARDARTNLFHFTSAGTPSLGAGQPAYLQDQGAMLQIYALLAWDPATYPKLT